LRVAGGQPASNLGARDMKHSQSSVRTACDALAKGTEVVNLSNRVRVVRTSRESGVSLGNVYIRVYLDCEPVLHGRFNEAVKHIARWLNA
jgi:hypothetical protein